MLNYCIARKCMSKRSETSINQELTDKPAENPEQPSSARSSSPGDDSSEDEFFEALEDQDDSDDSCGDVKGTSEITESNMKREGALKRCGDLRLLVSGEPLHVPVTQVGYLVMLWKYYVY